MDTSDLPKDHPCYSEERKKVPGMFTDEVKGNFIDEFVALRAKSYAFSVSGLETIKAKGVKKHVIKNNLTLKDHKKCLFNEIGQDPLREMYSIRSYKHRIHTILSKKLALNFYDDKRYVLEDGINTLTHGHYRIE